MSTDLCDRIQSVASGLRKEAKSKILKPPTNDKGVMVLRPEDIRAIEKKKKWEERKNQPGHGKSGPHQDQNRRFDHGRQRRNDRDRGFND